MSESTPQPSPAAEPTSPSESAWQQPPQTAQGMRKGRRLGRGLASLISVPAVSGDSQPGFPSPAAGPAGASSSGAIAAASSDAAGQRVPPTVLLNIDVNHIQPNPHQPRRDFDEEALAGLAESIRVNGIVQPILVRRRPIQELQEGSDPRAFQLVAGERRWRAARLAGLAAVPAIVKTLDEDALLELALVENIQRADLNPLERAGAYRAVMRRHGASQDILAQRLGESRASVGHYLRLLEMPEPVRQLVAAGRLSFSHVKPLMGLRQPDSQVKIAQAAVRHDWSVRQVEQLVAQMQADPSGEDGVDGALERAAAPKPAQPTRQPPPKPSNIVALEEKLTRRLGTRVIIRQGRRADMGKVVIDFYCLDDFDRILDSLGVTMD